MLGALEMLGGKIFFISAPSFASAWAIAYVGETFP